MKDPKILVLTVALKYQHDYFRPISYQQFVFILRCIFTMFEKRHKAPFLEAQGHARMKDLKIRVPMVALKPLHDFFPTDFVPKVNF